jgi:hypothetical protein
MLEWSDINKLIEELISAFCWLFSSSWITIILFSKFINKYLSNVDALCNSVTCNYVQWIPIRHLTITNTWSPITKKNLKGFHRLSLSTFNCLRMNNTTALQAEHVKCKCFVIEPTRTYVKICSVICKICSTLMDGNLSVSLYTKEQLKTVFLILQSSSKHCLWNCT